MLGSCARIAMDCVVLRGLPIAAARPIIAAPIASLLLGQITGHCAIGVSMGEEGPQ